MSNPTVGVDVPGNLHLAARPPTAGGATSVTFGKSGNQLTIDNSSTPPAVRLGGGTLSTSAAEFYDLFASDTAVPLNGDLSFPGVGPASLTIVRSSGNTQFQLPSNYALGLAPVYDISWQATVSEPCQLGLYCHSGEIDTVTGPGPLLGTIVGRESNVDLIIGRALIRVQQPDVVTRISVRNYSVGAITLVGNAGGVQPTAATLIIRRLQ